MQVTQVGTSCEVPQIDFATLDLLPYGVIVVNEQGRVLYYNAREEQIACRNREDVIGKNFFSEVAPCTQVKEFHGRFQETMNTHDCVANFNFCFPFPDRPRNVEVTLTSFENKGEMLCLIAVSDVTEQSLVREHILQAERLRELGEVAAGVAHNFNNLLTSINGSAQLLLHKMKSDDPARPKVERILKASNDGAEMVRRIKESARQQPEALPTAEMVDLNEIILDSLQFTEDYACKREAERGVCAKFETALADDLQPLPGSASELRELFVNLLRNAVDALTADGRITVRSRFEVDRHIVEVGDTGAGMSPDVMEKLFRPFFTTKGEEGTGLGLATCYAIVRRHNGNIEVRSAPNQGTTFIVHLPVATR